MRQPILALSVSFFALTGVSQALAQTETVQVVVIGETPVESTGGKALIEGLERAKGEARRNAWRVIKARPDLANKVRNLTVQQNVQMGDNLADACQAVLINQSVDKTLKVLSARYRFDCNQQDIIVSLDNAIRAQPPSIAPAASRLKLVSFFVVKEIASTTNYDADVDRRARAVLAAGTTNTSRTEDEFKGDVKARTTADVKDKSREGYGDGAGATNSTYSESGQVTSRAQVKGRTKSESTSSSTTAVAAEAAQQSSGRVVTRSADFTYRSISPEDLNADLTDAFRNGGVKIVHYTTVSADPCVGTNAPDPDKLSKAFGNSAEDLSSTAINNIVSAVRKCGFSYLLIGDATVDGTATDQVTGSPKYTVTVRAKVLDLADRFADTLATLQKDGSSSSPTASKARADAISLASQRTGEEVLNRLTAAGVR